MATLGSPWGCGDAAAPRVDRALRRDLGRDADAARDASDIRSTDVTDDVPARDATIDAFAPPCTDPGAGAPGCIVDPAGLVVGRSCDYAAYRIHPAPWSDPKVAALIGRDAGGLYARSAICTHRNCVLAVPKAVISSGLVCPCHYSTFDHYGRVLSGPAQFDLPSVALALRCDGQLVVDLKTTVDPSLRLDV